MSWELSHGRLERMLVAFAGVFLLTKSLQILPGWSPCLIRQPVLRFLRTSASSENSLPCLWGCSDLGQPEPPSSELPPSSTRGLQLLMELPDADLDLLGGCLYGIVGCKEKKLHLFVLLLEL